MEVRCDGVILMTFWKRSNPQKTRHFILRLENFDLEVLFICCLCTSLQTWLKGDDIHSRNRLFACRVLSPLRNTNDTP